MALEEANFISELVKTNPEAGDPVSEGDDQIRLTKSVLLNSFPNVDSEVTASGEELSSLNTDDAADGNVLTYNADLGYAEWSAGGDGVLPEGGEVKDTLVSEGDGVWATTNLLQVDVEDTSVKVNGEIVADGIISTAGIGAAVFTDTGRNVEVGPFGILQQSTFDAADIIRKDAEGDVEVPRTLTAAGVFATSGGVGAGNLATKGRLLEVGDFGIITQSAYTADDIGDGGGSDGVPLGRTITTGAGLSGGGDLSEDRTLKVDSTVLRTTGDQTITGSFTAAGYAANGGSFGSTLFANKGRLLQVGDFGIIEQASFTAADLDGVPTTRTISSGSGLSGGGNLSQNRTLSVDNTVLRTSGDQTTSGALTATGFVASSGSFGSVQFNTKGRLLQVGDFGIIEQATVSAADLGGVPTGRTLTAGDGLSGGGNLSQNRSFAVDSSVIRTSGTQTFTGTKTFNQTTEFKKNITNSGMQAGAGPTLVNAFSVIGYASSDRRLKTDIVDGVMGIETIMQMRPVEFTWNDKTMMPGMKDIGFIAQEQQEISEHLVSDTMEWLTLRSDNLNPILVKAIQQQQEVIEKLTTRIEQLEAGA